MYPAAYPEVIAVGATDSLGGIATFSNNGLEVDIWAPGTDVISTDMAGGFGIASGTSMAAPHVTGTVALMLALDPWLSPAQVAITLVNAADVFELDVNDALWTVYNSSSFEYDD
jgi:subtilisin family serine protease